MPHSRLTQTTIPPLKEFFFQIKYTETTQEFHKHEINLHSHNEFEIYINLAGDVSFLVKNNLYPLTRGDVIIIPPGELHHCVYRSNATHKLFWILFDNHTNPLLTNFIYQYADRNYISPPADLKNELIQLCFSLLENKLPYFDKLYSSLRLLKILEISMKDNSQNKNTLPEDLQQILDYIAAHLSEPLQIANITDTFFISPSTLERRFKEYIDLKPLEFIQKSKLTLAAQLLREGESVLNAGLGAGYMDNSYFIELFKRQFGVTPFQYKKNNTPTTPTQL